MHSVINDNDDSEVKPGAAHSVINDNDDREVKPGALQCH